MKIKGVDLFCGAGGLTHGLVREGISISAGIDLDPACRYPYEANNRSKFIKADVSTVTGSQLAPLLAGADFTVLAGCAPCQPFSTYTQGLNASERSEWALLRHFLRLVRSVRPDVVTMENVPQLRSHRIFDEFVAGLKRAKYEVSTYVVDCEEYGVPQTRRRLVLLASKHGKVPFSLRSKSRRARTVKETIGGLRALTAGGVDSSDPIHVCSRLSSLNTKRIKASVPGGTWRDWDPKLVAKCHTRKKGKSYPGVYGRMEWDKPAPTITTQAFGFGNGRFGHPEQNRGISLREAALLQTFPARYAFVEKALDTNKKRRSVNIKNIGRLIGNAVPVRLGEVIGRSIVNHLAMVEA